MVHTAEHIRDILRDQYPNIRYLEANSATTGRYREKHIIVFEYTNIAGNPCVLKFFSLQHIDETGQEQEKGNLLEEFRTIKKFGLHPNVVQVYDANELRRDGKLIGFYITMEKFDTTLSDLLKANEEFGPDQVTLFLEQMDRVLYTAHYELDEPIVHSDIKPANIGVRRGRDGGYEYALMDFDVSVSLERKSTDGDSFTLSNKASLKGITLAYAPPEQVMAYLHRSGDISNRVDVYAVGAIAMQMLTGSAPVKDANQMYYRLPFDQLPKEWRPVFERLCAPDAGHRSRRVADGLQTRGQDLPAPGGQTGADDQATMLVKGRGSGSQPGQAERAAGTPKQTKGSGLWPRRADADRTRRLIFVAIGVLAVVLVGLVAVYLTGSDALPGGYGSSDPVQIVIQSSPGGAVVKIDGEPVGRTDDQGELVTRAVVGERDISLELEGYEPAGRRVMISQEGSNRFGFSLSEQTGRLDLRIEPEDASVQIDGEAVEATGPLELAVGSHSLRVSRSGYGTYEEQLEIEQGQTLVLPVSLVSEPGGLAFTVSPSHASAVLRASQGGEVARWTGNRRMENLEAGTYRIEVSAPGHEAHSAQVRIDRGQVRNLSVSLSVHTGGLNVTSSPSGAQVRLLGSDGREVTRWTGSRRMEDLPVGRYKLDASAAGYHSRTTDLQVRHNEATSVRLELELDYHRDTGTAVVEVRNPRTGRVWMDRNLGASRAARSSTDSQAYGDLYQWGREADGHQKRNSPTTSTLSRSDQPGHGSFILSSRDTNWNWRNPQNDNLWQGVNGINNPCPPGYRLPTAAEWEAERRSWSSNNSAGAFASPLKLPLAGRRSRSSGSLFIVGSSGYYWSSTVSGSSARFLTFSSSYANMVSYYRAYGFSVRCTKD
ncbi:PEGA domain-containing protein [Balneolaceae bacterium ANBcel3]|nr:PEGA domain-containing protein [Balneolaceae bacterium ANBcel3]